MERVSVHLLCVYLLFGNRRYVVLIKTHLMTFAGEDNLTAPTEIIPINNCCTVKSADDELNIKNSFVSTLILNSNSC